MNQLRNLKIIIVVLVVLLILVIVRSFDQNLFKKDVNEAIKGAQSESQYISLKDIKSINNPYLVVNLGHEEMPDSIHVEHSIHLPFENLLDRSNLKILEEANAGLILFSTDATTAAKAWVILNQLGFNDVRILTSEENPEVLKYKFQPDTLARLEQDSI